MSYFAVGITAYAGNINAAEQSVIDFYNGTFTYNGKTYQATEAAKSAAYNKLMEDDVDLTPAQAKSAIRQARSNIKKGIDEGHLVEVGGSSSGTGNEGSGGGSATPPEDSSGSGNGSGSGTTTPPGGNSGSGNSSGSGTTTPPGGNGGSGSGTTTPPGGNGGSGSGNATIPGSNSGSGNGNATSPGGSSSGAGNGGNSGTGSNGSGNYNADFGGSDFDWTNPESGVGGNSGTGSGGQEPGATPREPKKIDVDTLFQKLKENQGHSTITGAGFGTVAGSSASIPESIAQIAGDSFTVEQYLEGKAMAVTKDGVVLLEADLPIKNTGFYNGDMKKLAIAAAIVFLLAMLGVVWLVRSKKEKKAAAYLGTPLVFALVLAGIFSFLLTGTLGNQLDKWKSLWVSGAPGYSYAYAQGKDAKTESLPTEGSIAPEETALPLSGDQYGELACEQIGLQAPLYNGDTEEILKKGAGTYAGGYLPGMGGTILIGAHDATFFAPLEDIKEKDVISLTTAYGKFQYSVTKTQAADLMDASAYKITDDGERLILYTCYPFGEEGQVRDQRYYVYAEKISGPEIGE